MDSLLLQFKTLLGKLHTMKVSYKRHTTNPKKDWMILLSVTAVLILVLAIFSLYFYVQINQGKFFLIENASKTDEAKVDMTLLSKIVADINLRQSLASQIGNKSTNTEDPSL